MLLHGAFDGMRFLVWGEVPPEQATTVLKPRGRRPKGSPPPPLPFDTGAEALTAALSLGSPEMEDRPAATTVLWLPSAAGRPVASSPLIEELREPTDGITLAPWTVSAFSLPLPEAMELLCRCVGRKSLAAGIFVADDLAFWATAMRYAGSLVAGGSFLPDLIEEDGALQARWRPAVTGNAVVLKARLAAAMPDA